MTSQGFQCSPECDTTCAYLDKETCGKMKQCVPENNEDGAGDGAGQCRWKHLHPAFLATANAKMLLGTDDGQSCQATLVHGTRTVDFNGIEIRGSYLKATVCKSDATNTVRARAEGLALWPAQGTGACAVKKLIYQIDELILQDELTKAFSTSSTNGTLDWDRVTAYQQSAHNSIAMVI